MTDFNNRPPISIVDLVIDKITDFTRELEILRGQLPTKEIMESQKKDILSAITISSDGLKNFLTTTKIIGGLAGGVILLSVLGSQLIDYVRSDGSQNVTIEEITKVTQEITNQMRKEMEDTHKQELEQLKQEIIDELKQNELENSSKE